MEPFGAKATIIATIVASLLCVRALRKKSLTKSGAASAFAVGFLSVVTGARGFNLLIFYQIGTSATKYKKDVKLKIDGTIATTGTQARGPSQVLACSLLAVVLGLVHAVLCGAEQPVNFQNEDLTLASFLTCAIIAHHATCLADTLASELGILSRSQPVLVTQPWRNVPSGTNGGVTIIGFIYSALGGLIIGISTLCLDAISGIEVSNILQMLTFSSTCGLLGSLIDSILGATIQQTYYDPDRKMVYQEEDQMPSSAKLLVGLNILSNEAVNMASVALTTLIGGYFLGPIFFGHP